MEILSHFANTFSDGINGFIGWFTNLFQYLVSIGVRPETIIIILVAGGLGILILLVLIFMGLSRFKLGRGNVKAPKREKASAEKVKKPAQKNASRFSAMFKPKADAAAQDAAVQDAAVRDSAGPAEKPKGFAIFKKKAKAARPKPAQQQSADPMLGQVVGQLAEIERDMLALKELYESGHIKVDVYVSESRTLYEKAKALT